MNYKEEWNKIGYNLEELYFEKANRELIEELKMKNAQQYQNRESKIGKVILFRSKSVDETSPLFKKAA